MLGWMIGYGRFFVVLLSLSRRIYLQLWHLKLHDGHFFPYIHTSSHTKFLFAKNPSILRFKLAIQACDNALSTYFLAETPMWHTDT